MNEYFQQLKALCIAGNVTNRDAVLKIIQAWASLKKALLTYLRNQPISTTQQQEDVQGMIDIIEMVNIWPWAGSLEHILQNVGSQTVLDHWTRVLNFVQGVMQGRTSVQSPFAINLNL